MARVADEANLVEALRRVCANKGSAGIDQMSVAELKAWFSQRTHREKLKEQLLSRIYQPALVRGVQIPKPGGKGVRQLGIPTVVDRLIQQKRVTGDLRRFDGVNAVYNPMTFKRITSQDLKLGVRWELSNPPVYQPPIVRKG